MQHDSNTDKQNAYLGGIRDNGNRLPAGVQAGQIDAGIGDHLVDYRRNDCRIAVDNEVEAGQADGAQQGGLKGLFRGCTHTHANDKEDDRHENGGTEG